MPDLPLWDLQRWQRSRAKGASTPYGTLYVGRPSRWGNPWIACRGSAGWSAFHPHDIMNSTYCLPNQVDARVAAVARFDNWLAQPDQAALRAAFCRTVHVGGYRYLSCWCPLDQPCHADVWIEVWQQYRAEAIR